MGNNPQWILRKFILQHKWSYTLSIFSIILSEIVTVQFPNLIGQFTDAFGHGKMTMGIVLHYTWMLAVIGALYVILYGIGQFRNGQIGRAFEYELRKILFNHWGTLHTGYFRKRSVGDLLNHAMNDVRAVREAMSGGVNILTNAIFLLLSTLWMTLRTVSVSLTLWSIVPLLLIPFFIVWWGPQIRHASQTVQESLSDMADLSEESMSSIRVIKSTGNEGIEVKRFTGRVDHIVERQMNLFKRSALFQSIIPLMGSLSFAIALIYGGYLTILHQIQLGMFVAFTLYLAMIITPIQQIGFVINNFQRASASMVRLGKLLVEIPEIQDTEYSIPIDHIEGDVRVQIDSFAYPDGEEPVLKEVNFHIEAGKTLGIVGKTGSGKTTLVNLLPRIFDPAQKSVFLDGYDVRDITLLSLRRAIAYVPQDGFLFSARIGENIGFGKSTPVFEEIEISAKNASLYDDIMGFKQKFDTEIGERGIALSGGQKQRTALARAMIKEAPVLIMDDSLSSVDMVTEKLIIDRIRELRREKTTLIVAHRLSAVTHADHIIVLDRGIIHEQGTHEKLINHGGIYAQMWKLQSEGEK